MNKRDQLGSDPSEEANEWVGGGGGRAARWGGGPGGEDVEVGARRHRDEELIAWGTAGEGGEGKGRRDERGLGITGRTAALCRGP